MGRRSETLSWVSGALGKCRFGLLSSVHVFNLLYTSSS